MPRNNMIVFDPKTTDIESVLRKLGHKSESEMKRDDSADKKSPASDSTDSTKTASQ